MNPEEYQKQQDKLAREQQDMIARANDEWAKIYMAMNKAHAKLRRSHE